MAAEPEILTPSAETSVIAGTQITFQIAFAVKNSDDSEYSAA